MSSATNLEHIYQIPNSDLEPDSIAVYEFTDKDITRLLGRINPNFPHIFTERIFCSYLESLGPGPGLDDVLIRIMNENPEYFSFRKTIPGNFRSDFMRFLGQDKTYGILNYINGRLYLRTITNIDVPKYARTVLNRAHKYRDDVRDEYKSAEKRLKLFQDRLKKIREELEKIGSKPVSQRKWLEDRKTLEEKLYKPSLIFEG